MKNVIKETGVAIIIAVVANALVIGAAYLCDRMFNRSL